MRLHYPVLRRYLLVHLVISVQWLSRSSLATRGVDHPQVEVLTADDLFNDEAEGLTAEEIHADEAEVLTAEESHTGEAEELITPGVSMTTFL